MNERGKSDGPIVPKKLANKDGVQPSAERAEGRGPAKGNLPRQNRFRTQGWVDLQHALGRIRQAAARDKQQRFTTLWHHVYDIGGLREAYFSLKPQAAPGVDGQTWQQYGENLEANLQGLAERLRRGAYRAKPVRRAYIPKSDGRQRPIGIPALEDKIVQRATTSVLQAVYETDFKGFSYGFRPGRSAHQALDALAMGITTQKVSWILDVDIRGFFDAIDHGWLMEFVEHRIADRRVLRHIRKWLNAGVLEEGRWTQAAEGTPQGGSISPLLANIYLHYVFDLWADHWRRHWARGDVVIVRYADDFVVGFQHRRDAEQFLDELGERFRKFNLELHADKTRLIEFGRYATERRARRGEGKPETFDFLGFTHICTKTKKSDKFLVYRRPMAKRMRAKLREINRILLRCRHAPVTDQGTWLRSVVTGWYQYYAIPFTYHTLTAFRRRVAWHWFRALRRRSQKTRMTWRRMYGLLEQWLPKPRILHPYPWQRVPVTTQGRSPVR
jgi:group II intron reverse transcriptase/maturase